MTDDQLALIQNELLVHITLTRQEPGCLAFDIDQATDNKNKFAVFEKFLNLNAFDEHQLWARNSRWGQVTKDVERHYQRTYGD